ncbi:glycoside hydrolase family 3 N-terminal domain-containing protein [Pseudomonas fulva]|uniref:glycoside hydrolase family 3 N-terminal domain-containing protein n=1 Tax=Pseudomonas fulva TaxID=47880 RepID=UPI0018AA60FC|nr:glycoside hydrolase family 3 N-terminal domain-containing protein [Pseudomonas fulva]MBF8774058.1 glycoside hydrolase family 3 protein [Pseudomonas fulva]
MNHLLRDAYAVLLPAFSSLELEPEVVHFLQQGGVSLLIGESRAEYLARAMSPERMNAESEKAFDELISTARRHAKSDLLIAVDQELSGIQRLHHLVPPLPSVVEAKSLDSFEIYKRAVATATAARKLGVNLFLSPIADVVSGPNPWLDGRNLGPDSVEVSRIACAFTKGIQDAGVVATGKHFPGHPITPLDPAIEEAVVECTIEDLTPSISVFKDLIASGIEAIMTGPALVPAVDSAHPSSTSLTTVNMLKNGLGFNGLVISDDLDAAGILRGGDLTSTAIAALNAGAELLLVSSHAGLTNLAESIANAVIEGQLSEQKLNTAATKVRNLAMKLRLNPEDDVLIPYQR